MVTKCYSELSFERFNIVAPLSSWFQNVNMSKTTHKSLDEWLKVEDVIEVEDDEADKVEIEADTHGIANPAEAKQNVQHMGEVLQDMMTQIEGGEVKDMLKGIFKEFKEVIMEIIPQMSDADIMTILQSIKDPRCLALCPQTEVEDLLKIMMSSEKIPCGTSMAGMVENIKPLIFDQKDMLVELFNDLEVAHNHMARICGRLSSLSKVLNPAQLMLVLKATVRPMVQLNAVQNFIDTSVMTSRKMDLPDDRRDWVKPTMIPDPDTEHLKKQTTNSAMWLLAATC